MNKKITGVLSLFLLTGCLSETTGGPTDITQLRSPSEPTQEIRHQSTGNIIGEYNRRIPAGPGEWRKQNDEQSVGRGGSS